MIGNYWRWRSLDYIQLSWNSRIDYVKTIEGFLCNKDQGRVLRPNKIVWFFWRWISNQMQKQGIPYRLILSKFGREWERKICWNSNFRSYIKWLIILGDGDRSIIFSSHEIQRLITEKLLRGFSVIRTRVEYSVRENTMIFWRWISNQIQKQGIPYRLILSKFGREWERKIC